MIRLIWHYTDPGKLTWNLKITQLKRKVIFQTSILGFHINFQGCMYIYMSISCLICLYGGFCHISHIFSCVVTVLKISLNQSTTNIQHHLANSSSTTPPPPTKNTSILRHRLAWTDLKHTKIYFACFS